MIPRVRALLVLLVLAGGGPGCEGGSAGRQRPAVTQPAAAPRGPAARHVDRERLMRDLAALADPALEGRGTGAPGGLRARAWVEAQFAAIGLKPAGSSGYLQPFEFTPRAVRGIRRIHQPQPAPGVGNAANVVARLDGTAGGARTLVISAHYDHLGVIGGTVYPGADDNASGVAVLLEAARRFRSAPLRHPVLFVAFDAEEHDLQGSRAFVASALAPLSRVALVVNLDMVSRSDRNEIFAAGTRHSPWLLPILQDVQGRSAVGIRFGHDRPSHLAGGLDDWTMQSDHGPFHEAGVPFVYFGVEDHADYHAPSDTADKVDPRFFGDVADMIVEAVRTLDRAIE